MLHKRADGTWVDTLGNPIIVPDGAEAELPKGARRQAELEDAARALLEWLGPIHVQEEDSPITVTAIRDIYWDGELWKRATRLREALDARRK